MAAQNALACPIYKQQPGERAALPVIPKRHTADYSAISQPEVNAVNRLVQDDRSLILQRDDWVHGLNCGEATGQTVMHTHLHLIPIRAGDTENARGGVRKVIDGKRGY